MDALEANKTFQHHAIDFCVEYDYTEDIQVSIHALETTVVMTTATQSDTPTRQSQDETKSGPLE